MKLIPGKNIADFMRLIRLPNLLIVALTMILMRYALVRPILHALPVELTGTPGIFSPMELQTHWYDFLVLVLSTILIAAGGYIINDYFDIRTDLINRGSIIVRKYYFTPQGNDAIIFATYLVLWEDFMYRSK